MKACCKKEVEKERKKFALRLAKAIIHNEIDKEVINKLKGDLN